MPLAAPNIYTDIPDWRTARTALSHVRERHDTTCGMQVHVRHDTTCGMQVHVRERHDTTCIRQHTSAYVGIRRHTSAYVGLRQHTSAYAFKEVVTSSVKPRTLIFSITGPVPPCIVARAMRRAVFSFLRSSCFMPFTLVDEVTCQHLYFCTSTFEGPSFRVCEGAA